jgi:endonuclease YncB( thermonuclease family)
MILVLLLTVLFASGSYAGIAVPGSDAALRAAGDAAVSNYVNSVADGTTNYVNSVAAGMTNYVNSVADGTTNYVNSVADGTTNYVNSVADGTTNYVNSVAAGTTNYVGTVAATNVNLHAQVVAGTNVLGHVTNVRVSYTNNLLYFIGTPGCTGVVFRFYTTGGAVTNVLVGGGL